MKSLRFKINGIQHRVYRWGNPRKPLLFLLHGWLDTGAGFDFLVRHFGNRFHCLAPDLRGYGKSAHTSNPLGYFFYEYVADVHELFGKISPKQAVNVLGHSLGGAVASVYAGTFPERVARLINVEGFQLPERNPQQAAPRTRHWIETIQAQRFRVFPTLKEFAERLRISNPALPLDRALFLARHLTKRVRGGWTMAADPKHKLPEPYLISLEVYQSYWDRIEAATLLVASDYTENNRRFSVFDSGETLRREPTRLPPKTRKIILEGCGHMVHHEKPEALSAEIIEFFFT